MVSFGLGVISSAGVILYRWRCGSKRLLARPMQILLGVNVALHGHFVGLRRGANHVARYGRRVRQGRGSRRDAADGGYQRLAMEMTMPRGCRQRPFRRRRRIEFVATWARRLEERDTRRRRFGRMP